MNSLFYLPDCLLIVYLSKERGKRCGIEWVEGREDLRRDGEEMVDRIHCMQKFVFN